LGRAGGGGAEAGSGDGADCGDEAGPGDGAEADAGDGAAPRKARAASVSRLSVVLSTGAISHMADL